MQFSVQPFSITKRTNFFLKYFFSVPHLANCIFLFFYNEPELGKGIDPGMALTPLPSSIGQRSNPQPSDREPSALPQDHSFCYKTNFFTGTNKTKMVNVYKYLPRCYISLLVFYVLFPSEQFKVHKFCKKSKFPSNTFFSTNFFFLQLKFTLCGCLANEGE